MVEAPQERNWRFYVTYHTKDWHGFLTRYAANAGEVLQSFKTLRSLKSISENTVSHLNRMFYPDGVKEKSWELSQQESSLPNGIVYPLPVRNRAIFFETGHGTWILSNLGEADFGVEMFFVWEEIRCSINIRYGKGKLLQLVTFREDSRGFPGKYWSADVEQISEKSFSSDWKGTSVTLSSDLSISGAVPIRHQWGWEEHKTHFLPDGITVSCPMEVSVGTELHLVGNWLVNGSLMHQMTIRYNKSGAFAAQTLDILELKNK